MFKIYDGREYFYQWDLDRKLIVYDETIKEVHFCNKTDDCSLVCEVYAEGELRLVNVPNILLQDNWRINVYGYDENYTKISKQFDVKSRTKPADYVYTETEVKQWEDLEERISAISEELKNYNEVLGYIEGEVGGSIPQVETAKEGQILSIKQVSPTGYPTEWEAVDLPNSTGSTTGSGEDIYYVKMAFVEGLYYTPNKSYEEVVEAFESGKDVRCKINIEDYPLNLPLLAVMKGEKIIVYGGIVAGIAISVMQTTTIANALYDNVLTMDHLDSTVVSQATYSTYTAQNDTNYSKLTSTVADINNQIGKTVPKVGSLLLNGEEGQVVALIKKDVVNPEWGLIDLPSGGGSVSALDWEYINTLSFVKDDGVASLYCSETADGNPFEYDEILIMNGQSDYGSSAKIWCNRETIYFADCATINSFLSFGQKKYCLLKSLLVNDDTQWILAESTNNNPVLYNIASDSGAMRKDGKITSVCVAKSDATGNAQATLKFYGRNYK